MYILPPYMHSLSHHQHHPRVRPLLPWVSPHRHSVIAQALTSHWSSLLVLEILWVWALCNLKLLRALLVHPALPSHPHTALEVSP